MKKIYTILVCLCMLASFVACEKDKEFVLTTLSVTGEVLAPTSEAATIQCKLSADATISEAYVHYSLTSSFEDYEEVKMTLVNENYSALLLNLADNTTYYIRYEVSNKYSQVMSKSVNSFKTERLTTPTVLLGSLSEIQETQAKVVMSVVYDGGCSVTEMGVCWSTSSNPTKQNSHTRYDGFAIDAVLEITDLQPNTTYYVRAYAVNKVGVAYSEEQSFTTLSDVKLPTLSTSTITQITGTTAVAGGNVTSDGNASVIERGVVYSTNQNPTTADTKVTSGSGVGEFTCDLTNLQLNTTYYVRAYAVNSMGTAYGEEVSFTTNSAMPFSVSADKQVYFSKGNLQYHPAKNKWRFAENQTDYIGDANKNCDFTYNGWLDLFGWSTNANNFGVSTSVNDNDYSGDFVDWGTNKIGNDAPNTWRTLTYDEWDYLLNTRTNASYLWGVAQVNGVNGLVFLPDIWTYPEGVTFKSGFHSSEGVDYYAAYQTFTADQWSKLEGAGAVFLPAAGYRGGLGVGNVQNLGYYWSATEYDSLYANYLYFESDEVRMSGFFRFFGCSVRLVKDL